MAFVTVLIGGFNPLTIEKVRHYPHPRPAIEQTVTHRPTRNLTHECLEPTKRRLRRISQRRIRVQRIRTPPLSQKTDPENRKPERKVKPERLAHLHQPKVLARQQQNYEGYGYGMALGDAEGYHPGLDAQR